MRTSIWGILLLFALLLTDFRYMIFYWLQSLEATALIFLLILFWYWYYR